MWKPKVSGCYSLCTTSFLLLMVQEGLCCGGNAAKSSAVLISPLVLLGNGSSQHLEWIDKCTKTHRQALK